jgi:protein NUD1
MEPWLDSLSDEWNSNKQSSSPSHSSGTPNSRASSRASNSSQSRIPHLTQNYSQSSRNGSFLRPRSSKGLARSNTSPVLAERTSSKLNVVAQKGNGAGRSTIPRRASTAFSGSINSVQHHTIRERSTVEDENTPEWKRRLARGEDIGGDGCDLFGPTRLEGIFKQPPSSRDGRETFPSSAVEPVKPWSMPDQYQSMRASRSKVPEMEVLAEEDEEDIDFDTASAGGDSVRRRQLRGVVRDRVLSLEHNSVLSTPSGNGIGSLGRDSRMRTSSGLEEIQNEEISPITTSRQNTIREQALKRLTEVPPNPLHSKLEDIVERPSSRSSDDGVLYGHNGRRGDDFGEITSLSLPEDLSMGTQDFATRGGFVNSRRGGRSTENSFQKKMLSSSLPPSVEHSMMSFQNPPFRSSPPPYNIDSRHFQGSRTDADVSPTTPRRPKDSDSSDRPRSSGSPLKLFGNYDTFTNEKLLRRMSQFQHDDAETLSIGEKTPGEVDTQRDMRVSHFGKGDLDKFSFDERVKREPLSTVARPSYEVRIFDSSIVTEDNARPIDLRKGSQTHVKEQATQGNLLAGEHTEDDKRAPSSSIKDRTPKRRRTLLQSELTQEPALPGMSKLISEATQLAGKKRKDARYNLPESAADPATLASRQMLRPKPARRPTTDVISPDDEDEDQLLGLSRSEDNMAEDLAGELATFGIGMAQIANDSRKPSVTTQDFLNEATKIMQIIRQRGKPKSGLSSVEEPGDEDDINPDSILDLEVDGEETTVDNFSRPPSRNGSLIGRREKLASTDPTVATHLQKYQDGDDLGLLITSKLGSLHLHPEAYSKEAALVPLPDDDYQPEDNVSSPPNIRIRETDEHQRKRKHSTATLEDLPSLPTHSSSSTSTGTTIPTCSTASSGNKGRIPPGMVPVPEQVGIMTYDHSTKSWVRGKGPQAISPASRKTNSEEDPFGDIPDLSIDELKEAERNALPTRQVEFPQTSSVVLSRVPVISSRPQTRDGAQILASETATGETKLTGLDSSMPVVETRATSWATADLGFRSKPRPDHVQTNEVCSDHDEEVEHEIRIHDGRASEAPPSPHRSSKKARAVTIAFSSPLVSAIAYHNESTLSDLDNSIAGNDLEGCSSSCSPTKTQCTSNRMQSSANNRKGPPLSGGPFFGRLISRIEEQDEDDADLEVSIVHVSQPNAMTPASKSMMAGPITTSKAPSMICLTPLSEFSLHQIDRARHLEASYVAERAHPTSLQQAHGSLALAVDELMRAITDAEPYELYWEHIRRLNLTDRKLTTLHRLEEYCSTLDELQISGNKIRQLSGVPLSVRTLSAHDNCLSSLTSWGHMQNLQYLDISGNVLESLDGLSCLTHLRELKANSNRIRNLEGILDLNGLLHLELQGNELTTVDFAGAELTRLHHLDLRNNRLASVKAINALPALRALYLERNSLREFGTSTETYHMLRDLRLTSNNIEVIDLAMTPSIELVYLDNNRIRSISGLGNARRLDVLSVREQSDSPNLLNTIFSASNECRKLYLSSNSEPAEGLKMPALPHLNLRYLELSSCGLSSLPTDFGKRIPNCRTLNLNFNAIKDLACLKGCGRLNKVMITGNRLSKLRRTCMALTRLPALTKIDLRDNPLTVGFYPPFRESRLVVHGDINTDVQDPYTLPPVDQIFDTRWFTHLDEGTKMKRRTMELFLAKGCEKLVELDGLAFDREALVEQDEIWQKLSSMGVLARPSKTASITNEHDGEEALSFDAEGNGVVGGRERSLFVE